jgi:hypothetical protein
MKNLFTILVLLSFSTCFSQAIFEKAPENAKEIHFVYEKKSKYILSKDGVYGDSIAFAIDFPAVKVTLRNHPTDTTKKSFFALYKNMNNDQERKLTAILYHTNEVYKGTHYIPSRVTVFYVTRYDEETKNAFKKYLSEQYFKFEYRQEFNFKPDADGTGTLVFAVHQGNWQVSNIGLRASQETNFSPNEVSLNVTMPTVVNNDIYDFKFEFYDINNNYVPVSVTQSALFNGGNTNIGGTILLISSSASSSANKLNLRSPEIGRPNILYFLASRYHIIVLFSISFITAL